MLFAACTQQERAKSWGGSVTYTLPSGRKLVNVTWKAENLWVLTRAMRPGETPETYELTEKAAWGVLEGSVKIQESR